MFLNRYFEVSGTTLEQLPVDKETNKVNRRLILEYHDRFMFEGDQQGNSPRGLLSDLFLSVLPKSILDQGGAWHLHRGWFEKIGIKSYLVNQNLDIQQDKSLAVMTRVEDRDYRENTDCASIGRTLDQMHDVSIVAVKTILTSSMQERTGLYGT